MEQFSHRAILKGANHHCTNIQRRCLQEYVLRGMADLDVHIAHASAAVLACRAPLDGGENQHRGRVAVGP